MNVIPASLCGERQRDAVWDTIPRTISVAGQQTLGSTTKLKWAKVWSVIPLNITSGGTIWPTPDRGYLTQKWNLLSHSTSHLPHLLLVLKIISPLYTILYQYWGRTRGMRLSNLYCMHANNEISMRITKKGIESDCMRWKVRSGCTVRLHQPRNNTISVQSTIQCKAQHKKLHNTHTCLFLLSCINRDAHQVKNLS